MQSLEVHTVADERDEIQADAVGLDLPDSDDVCEHCESRVGRGRGKFVPYVVVLNDRDELWFICQPCASPVTEPGDEE